MHKISIIIPVYNEEKIIVESLHSLYDFFKGKDIEIIVVDDGSSDKTYEKLSGIKLPDMEIIRNHKNYGKGYAVKKGILRSKGELVFYTDADISTPIEEFPKLEKKIDDGYDIAIGSRNLPGSIISQRQPIIREFMGKIFGLFASSMLSYTIKDTQCGFKLLKGNISREIITQVNINGYSFDIELLLMAKQRGLNIAEIPVKWKNNSNSKIRLFSDIYLVVFSELFRILINKLRGYY